MPIPPLLFVPPPPIPAEIPSELPGLSEPDGSILPGLDGLAGLGAVGRLTLAAAGAEFRLADLGKAQPLLRMTSSWARDKALAGRSQMLAWAELANSIPAPIITADAIAACGFFTFIIFLVLLEVDIDATQEESFGSLQFSDRFCRHLEG